MFRSVLPLLSVILVLSACASEVSRETAHRVASSARMIERYIGTDHFTLQAYERIYDRGAAVNLYIEGEGQIVEILDPKSDTGLRIEREPLGHPLALHLASADTVRNAAYLDRPCQSALSMRQDRLCDPSYWSYRAFAPEVIETYKTAMNDIKRRYGVRSFNLIGVSGGGAIAAILAATRDDVVSLRTVAGNLDHVAKSYQRGIMVQAGSLNPTDYAANLSTLPQIHFVGGQDTVTHPSVLQSYLQALGDTNCAKYSLIQEAGHQAGWADKWADLIERRPSCRP